MLAAVVLVTAAPAAHAEVTDEAVRRCITLAVKRLKAGQKADGHWEVVSTRAATGGYGGMTALAVFALLQAGEPLDDPAVARGLEVLTRVPDRETYTTSLKIMALAKAEQVAGKPLYRGHIEAAVRWLQSTQSAIGTWGYEAGDIVGEKQAVIDNTDNSNTQMAVLGLYEASRAGYKVNDPVWKRTEGYYVRTQEADGSWRYRHGTAGAALTLPKSGSMTAAGLATLMITGSRLQEASDCGCGGGSGSRYRTNQPVAQALGWLAKHFTVTKNPGLQRNAWHHYYLYALERVGMLSGLRQIGGHDWFGEGAAYLVSHQLADGRFSRAGGDGVAQEYDTALAILFLAKGHVPALAGKLRWSNRTDQWNANMYDLENLTRWIGDKLNGRPVGWQTVSLSDSLAEWLKAPVLVIAGRTPPKFSKAHRTKLRRYIEQGGTIVADARCGSKEFADAMRQLAGQLFPGATLAPLPEDHPVYTSYEKLAAKWPLEGLMMGCRSSFLLSTKDLSCSWELAGRPQSLAGLKMGLNVAAYATAREPLPERFAPVTALADSPKVTIDRMALAVGKVRHHGRDWNSRPHAMDRLLELLRTESGIKVATRAAPVKLTDDSLSRFPILYMVGHYDPAFTAAEKQRLKDYLDRGGFLFAEACCGMPGFDRAFRGLMAEVYPDAPLKDVPADSPLLSGQAGHRIERVQYTPKVLAESPGLTAPRLLGLKLGDRYAVVYSPYAIGPGLDGIATLHARGYVQDDARRIAVNILLYALKF